MVQPPLLSQEYTSLDGSPLPRCNLESSFTSGSSRVQCPPEYIINYANLVSVMRNDEFRRYVR